MANDSSLQGDATQFVFDLDSQKGVTQLLASVRASSINAEQKNEVRDLIFLYANGGRDQSVRLTLEQKIFTYKIVPLVVESKAPVVEVIKPKHIFGTSRPSPSFIPAVKAIEKTATTTPVEQQTKKEEVNILETVIPNIIDSVPVEVPVVESTPVVESVAPKPQPEPTLASVVPQAQPEPTVLPLEPVQVPESAVPYDPNQALLRIREIKSLVNDKVGNPVNLVDINNEVGREYMGALLDAMKKLNTGTSTISAMKRLETAYELVEKTIIEHNKKPIVKEGENLNIPTPQKSSGVDTPSNDTVMSSPHVSEAEEKVIEPPVPVPVVEEIPRVVSPDPISIKNSEISTPIFPAVSDAPTMPVAAPLEVPAPPTPMSYPNDLPISQPEVRKVSSLASSPVPRPEPAPQEMKAEPVKVSSEPVKNESMEGGVVSAWGSDTDTIIHDNKSTAGRVDSLAQSKIKLRTPDELPLASSLETSSVAGDSLYTKQVDEGLDQLLLEWSLFKKSGLFGTGPKGREHPLFLKMVGLQIPLLLAGRFEGATQEIKQSITDYMNGWRYEQGIVYEQGETFEHYLRRVIRHILDLQKK